MYVVLVAQRVRAAIDRLEVAINGDVRLRERRSAWRLCRTCRQRRDLLMFADNMMSGQGGGQGSGGHSHRRCGGEFSATAIRRARWSWRQSGIACHPLLPAHSRCRGQADCCLRGVVAHRPGRADDPCADEFVERPKNGRHPPPRPAGAGAGAENPCGRRAPGANLRQSVAGRWC